MIVFEEDHANQFNQFDQRPIQILDLAQTSA